MQPRALKTHRFESRPHFTERLKKVKCLVPTTEFHIYEDGYVSNCCFSWLPTEIGNILENSLIEMLERQESLAIQKSVEDGTYKFCSIESCPSLNQYLHSGKTSDVLIPSNEFSKERRKSVKIYLSYDKSCNLFCESCRNEKIFFSKHNAPPVLLQIHERVYSQILELLEKGYRVHVGVTGSGDAFAAPLFFDLIKKLPNSPLLTFVVLTNGTMMTRLRLRQIASKNINYVSVSVDAASKNTYEKVRRGGRFESLEKNLIDFDTMLESGELGIRPNWELNFIVQTDNFHEMGDFVSWASQFRTKPKVSFMLIQDWGHLWDGRFPPKAVWYKGHPQHREFLSSLKDPRLLQPNVNLGNLVQYLNDELKVRPTFWYLLTAIKTRIKWL